MNLWRKNESGGDAKKGILARVYDGVINYFLIGVLTLAIFYLSLLTSSLPVDAANRKVIDRAIGVLESKGFTDEVYLLRQAVFRENGNWLNYLTVSGNAYAATNYPFGIITVYPDFFYKAVDDTERAAILLHEAQHLQGRNEEMAYKRVWWNRKTLGWTQLSHGTTESYVTIELQTREFAPDLFTCYQNLWSDCTESRREVVRSIKGVNRKQ